MIDFIIEQASGVESETISAKEEQRVARTGRTQFCRINREENCAKMLS